MAHVIPFSDEHRQVDELLPWFVNGTLDPAERARVEAHLAGCADCRDSLAVERRLAEAVAGLPGDADPAWERLRDRIAPVAATSRRPKARAPARWVWGAIAAQFFVVVVGFAGIKAADLQKPRYQTLGSPAPQANGNLIVAFRPDTKEAEMRRLLEAVHARLVDGPTAAGAYVLRVPAAERGRSLDQLRSEDAVTLAQPLDGSPR